jgi:hypothetical protein
MFIEIGIKRLFSVLILSIACLFLVGCDEEIASKLLMKEQLTANEQKRYASAKNEIDKLINKQLSEITDYIMSGDDVKLTDNSKAKLANNRGEVDKIIDAKLSNFSLNLIAGIDLDDKGKKIRDRYIHRLQNEFVPATEAKLRSQNQAAYKRYNGTAGIFDVSDKVRQKFGFNPGDRISTSFGNATVVGIFDDHLWFHIDGKKGATFWSSIDQSFKLLEPGKESKQEKRVQSKPVPAVANRMEPANQAAAPERFQANTNTISDDAEGIYFERLEPIPKLKYLR